MSTLVNYRILNGNETLKYTLSLISGTDFEIRRCYIISSRFLEIVWEEIKKKGKHAHHPRAYLSRYVDTANPNMDLSSIRYTA